MRWIVAIPVLLALAMALTGPALAQELRIFENIEQSPPPVVTVLPPAVVREIPQAPASQQLGDRGIR